MNFKMTKVHIKREEEKLFKFLEMHDNKFIKYIPTKNSNLSFLFIPDVSKKDSAYVESVIDKVQKGARADSFNGDVRMATIDFETAKYFVDIHFNKKQDLTESMIKLKEELGPFLIYVDSRYEDQVETNVGRKLFEMKRASKKYIQREKSNYSENE